MIGDESRLKQVLSNLVKNALKFTERGEVKIKACYMENDKLLIVHIRDTGKGISQEDFHKLFSRFG